MSLLELLVALSAFAIIMAAASVAQVSMISLSRSNQEASVALDAAQSTLEAMRDEELFLEIFPRWNGITGDDPVAGLSPGNAFDVEGLEPTSDDPDGRVGEIVFPGDGAVLIENALDRVLGTPRDIDLDGSIDGTDQASDYRVLPVLVRVRWRGPRSDQQVQVVGTFTRR